MNRYGKSILQFSLSELLLLTIAASFLLFLNCREQEVSERLEGFRGVVDCSYIGIGWPYPFKSIAPIDTQEIQREAKHLSQRGVTYKYEDIGVRFFTESFLTDLGIGLFLLVCFRGVLLLFKNTPIAIVTKNAGDHS